MRRKRLRIAGSVSFPDCSEYDVFPYILLILIGMEWIVGRENEYKSVIQVQLRPNICLLVGVFPSHIVQHIHVFYFERF